jgi:hypothetical protein
VNGADGYGFDKHQPHPTDWDTAKSIDIYLGVNELFVAVATNQAEMICAQ